MTNREIDHFINLGKHLAEIALKRNQIQEDYVKAWLAANVPDENLNPKWLINNVEMVEEWSQDRVSMTYYMRFKLKNDQP